MNPRIDTELRSPGGVVQVAIRIVGRAILVMQNRYGTSFRLSTAILSYVMRVLEACPGDSMSLDVTTSANGTTLLLIFVENPDRLDAQERLSVDLMFTVATLESSGATTALYQEFPTCIGHAFFGNRHQITLPSDQDAGLPYSFNTMKEINNFLVILRQSQRFLCAHGGINTRFSQLSLAHIRRVMEGV